MDGNEPVASSLRSQDITSYTKNADTGASKRIREHEQTHLLREMTSASNGM